MESKYFEHLKKLRRELHREPELSNNEKHTAFKIITFLRKFQPDVLITEIGGNGVCAGFKGRLPGPSVMFRCELDALPIKENNIIQYRSIYNGVSHVCGHDGHMAMVSGLAYNLSKRRPDSGNVYLLFQPAEETGEGAERVVKEPKFKEIKPDFVFAYHNLPGFETNKVLLASDEFASASVGMEIRLTGKSSHAAEPEKGKNPSEAVSRIISEFNALNSQDTFFNSFKLITIIHAKIGEIAYGTSPGEAMVNATLRAYQQNDMDKLTELAEAIVMKIGKEENLGIEIRYIEPFPVTKNDAEQVKMIDELCEEIGISKEYLKKPFRWSEDFGHFTRVASGAMIGIGSGKEQPALHNPDFDFPDQLIPEGIKLLEAIYHKILNK